MTNPTFNLSHDVLLELKFTNRFPDWFRELVRVFGTVQWEGDKYREAMGS
jgi:hypothetical protein